MGPIRILIARKSKFIEFSRLCVAVSKFAHTRAHVLNQPTLPYLKVIIFFKKTIRTLNESESESESVILETISALWILKSLNFDGVEIFFFYFAQEFIVLFWWNKYYIGNNVIVMMNNEKSNYCNRLSRAKM